MTLDPKRKGVVLGCMTEEERQELQECARRDTGLMVFDDDGKWSWKPDANGDSPNWCYWPKDKPAHDAVVRKIQVDARGGAVAEGCTRIVFPGNHDGRGYTYLRSFATLEHATKQQRFYAEHGTLHDERQPGGGWVKPFDDEGRLLAYVLCVRLPRS